MNREVKFKVYQSFDDDLRPVHKGFDFINKDGIWSFIRNNRPDEWFGVISDNQGNAIFNRVQYTGVKDKNGKEIFDGDIVKGVFSMQTGEERRRSGKRTYNTYPVYSDVEIFSIVNFCNGSFYASSDIKVFYYTSFWRGCGVTRSEKKANEMVQTYSDFNRLLYEVSRNIEVIGNIFENPELLKQYL